MGCEQPEDGAAEHGVPVGAGPVIWRNHANRACFEAAAKPRYPYVVEKTVSVSQRRKLSLSLNCCIMGIQRHLVETLPSGVASHVRALPRSSRLQSHHQAEIRAFYPSQRARDLTATTASLQSGKRAPLPCARRCREIVFCPAGGSRRCRADQGRAPRIRAIAEFKSFELPNSLLKFRH